MKGDMTIKMDEFFTDTRVRVCLNTNCRFNLSKEGLFGCNYKNITIGMDGECCEMKKSKKKFYNPYPFVIRVTNDLGRIQILAPQGHCKIFKDDPSGLELVLLPKKKERKHKAGLGIDLGELTKKRLISLAWMLIVEEGEEVLETMVKAPITTHPQSMASCGGMWRPSDLVGAIQKSMSL
ncbi:unnamed protein product [marine sediment metagenome]|uniref:Uncharacterized protein n=1 Tax=marine sediment metagenome TaxID=412755 RepID=X1LR87_9ZZZZ